MMNKEVTELLNKLGSMEDAPLVWINRKVIENEKRINRAIEYIGNKNIGIPKKTREKAIKILRGLDDE